MLVSCTYVWIKARRAEPNHTSATVGTTWGFRHNAVVVKTKCMKEPKGTCYIRKLDVNVIPFCLILGLGQWFQAGWNLLRSQVLEPLLFQRGSPNQNPSKCPLQNSTSWGQCCANIYYYYYYQLLSPIMQSNPLLCPDQRIQKQNPKLSKSRTDQQTSIYLAHSSVSCETMYLICRFSPYHAKC